MVDEFLRDADHVYLIRNSIGDVIRLFEKYRDDKHQYYYTLYEFFSKERVDKKKAGYYLEMMR